MVVVEVEVVVDVVDVVVDVLTTEVVVVSCEAEVAVPQADTTRNPARINSRLITCAVYPRPQMHLRRPTTRGINPISCTVQG